MKCTECKKETSNEKFCSRSCACAFNNRHHVKRTPKKTRACIDCGTLYLTARSRRSRCEPCFAIEKARVSSMTIGEVRDNLKAAGVHPSWGNSTVRSHGRIANKNRQKSCQVCGYDKHVEYCHIKAISSFPSDATLGDINDPSNIAILCRNHHWELDHGVLTLP
jgi:hypothetical protein